MDRDQEKQLVGEFFRKQRVNAGLKQSEIASSMGVSQGVYSQIERGKRCPETLVLFRMAEALGLEIAFVKKSNA